MLRVFSGVVIVYFTNILSASAQNLKLQNIPELENQNRSLRDCIYETKQVFLLANSECSRYCIKPPEGRVIENTVIFWNTTQDTFLGFYDEPTTLRDDLYYIKKSMKPILYVSIGCGNSTFTNGKNKNDSESPTLVRAFNGNANEEFTIKNDTRIIKITIKEKNNPTSLLFQMPPELGETTNDEVLELSLMRNSFTNKFQVLIINPPIGTWQIKLSQNERPDLIDSIYINHNMRKIKNITLITAPKGMNSPEKLRSRDADVSGINPTGEQITMKIETTLAKTLNKYNRMITKKDINMNEGNNVLADLTQETNDLKSRMKALEVDLALETTLVVPPNTVQPIIFSMKNYLPTTILCTFRGSSSKFRIIAITPSLGWIRPGEIFKVAVYIRIPNANDGIVNTITLHVEHQSNLENVMKSAYVYIESSNTTVADHTKPTIDYFFNNNCAGKLEPQRCDDSEWSTEITVTDNESGVKNVMSHPNGIQSKTNFIAGMKGSVILHYRSSCCYTTVRITAIDVAGNSHTREVDVTAWDNLTEGDIAAIIIGALFLLFIIIFTISLCIYCVKERRSKNITFTQRYGSRSNPRVERTNI